MDNKAFSEPAAPRSNELTMTGRSNKGWGTSVKNVSEEIASEWEARD